MDTKIIKQQLLNDLYKPYKACSLCPLGSLGRTNVVFGTGNPDAKLMLVGEGPGKDEDEQAMPFVGRSGKLLTKALNLAGIDRNNVFITNVVKCRPPENRAPKPLEIDICKKILLMKEIEIVKPAIICPLGSSALTALIDETLKITSVRGTIISHHHLNIMPTFHPAYILRNPKQTELFVKDLNQAYTQANLSK